MTNLEAIKGRLNYPLPDNSFIVALQGRDLDEVLTYVKGQAFDLAYADAIGTLLTSPNISEGGYTISISDRANLAKVQAGIYVKYGQYDPLKPTATFVHRW